MAEHPGFIDGAPDLAIGIISPSQSAAEIREKVRDYLGAGASIVWVVDPATRTIAVRGPHREVPLLRPGDDLDGGEVVPRLRIPLTDLFLE